MIRKDKWEPAEDARLAALVAQHGAAWAEIARSLVGRTDQQCMGRWRRHLDPAIRREGWSPEEDAALTALVAQHGSRWSAVARGCEGRTAQQCRARWFQVGGGGAARRPRPRAPRPRKPKAAEGEEGAGGGGGEWLGSLKGGGGGLSGRPSASV